MTYATEEEYDLHAGQDADEWLDSVLGTAHRILMGKGDLQAAALLEDVDRLDFATEQDWRDGEWVSVAYLSVTPEILDRYDGEEFLEEVRQALQRVTSRHKPVVVRVSAVPKILPAGTNWRERGVGSLLDGSLNQAAHRPDNVITADGLRFRSQIEVRVYRKFMELNVKLEDGDRITYIPNTTVRADDSTIEVDGFVLYRGRVAGIEIDGPTHRGRWSHDQSRDRILQNSGVRFVDRISERDVDNDEELTRFVRQVMRRLFSPS